MISKRIRFVLPAIFITGSVILTGGWTLLSGPFPVSITITCVNGSVPCKIPDNATAGQIIASATVIMSDGSDYTGKLTSTPNDNSSVFPAGTLSGMSIPLARNLAPSDDGAHTTTIIAK